MMSDSSDFSVGHFLSLVREESGLTQAALSSRLEVSTATLSRIESGDKSASPDEIQNILSAIGTTRATALGEYLKQSWDQIERPSFDHPDWQVLWEANLLLCKLDELRNDPDVKSVFIRQMDLYEKEIRRICDFLKSREHQVAFIGGIGVGKSTAICKLAGLINESAEKFDRQVVLETGAGGITICEVHIVRGPRYGLRIVPRDEDSIRKDVEDFAEYLFRAAHPATDPDPAQESEEGDSLGISKEVVRAIRNMSGLTEKRKEENGKKVRVDPAKDLALQYESSLELSIQILTRMNLLRRNKRDAWYPEDNNQPPATWLQKMFLDVNNGRSAEFTLPKKIEVVIPAPVFKSADLPLRVIDTKGIDQTAERRDLECHLDDPRTLVVLCSRFNDAPEVAIQTLLNRAKESGIRDLVRKTVLMVLARPDEAMAVKHDDGERVEDEIEGYELKGDQVRLRLAQKDLGAIPIEFFNAKEESCDDIRDRLVGMLVEYRRFYASKLGELASAVETLIENRKNEEVKAVFENVCSDLGSWIDHNRELVFDNQRLEEPLISAIDATRYAATIRASVSRKGDWANLDYYHHLAYGVRKLAVEHISKKITQFEVIVQNKVNNPEFTVAKEFLERMLENAKASVEEGYRKLQYAGGEVFKQVLEQDYDFWRDCDDRWGRGAGYRTAIADMTGQRFVSSYEEAYRLIRKLIDDEWGRTVESLEEMLKEKAVATS